MALINWKDEMSVNVVEIDNQHKKLIAMINDLHDAMKQRKGNDVLGEILNGLASYAVEHFTTEEKYFDQFGYAETDSHKEVHADFVQKVLDFKEKFEKGDLALTIEVMNFLSDWLKTHIMKTDKKYAEFFNENGLR